MNARAKGDLVIFTPEKGITIKANGLPIKARYLSGGLGAFLTRIDATQRHTYYINYSHDGPDSVGNDGFVYDCPEWKGPNWPILIFTQYSTPPPCMTDQMGWSLDIMKNGDHKFITDDDEEIIISEAQRSD
jgi:hypothetical protein